MKATINGLHHVTAIASDAQANYDFYAGVLGLRMVKKTVNFDDPASYHFYFGDKAGSPGTIITFFIWQGAQRGRLGTGQTSATAFSISADSFDFWKERLKAKRIKVEDEAVRFGERVLVCSDPDGLEIELIGANSDAREGWSGGGIPPEYAIKGFHSVTLSLHEIQDTESALTASMGFAKIGEESGRVRYASVATPSYVDLFPARKGTLRGRMGAGTAHHVAFSTADDAQQAELRESLIRDGFQVSPIMDRTYFHSIYFREPGGVLFEIATVPPGFTLDESIAELGSGLKLPDWLESRRDEIEAKLPPLKTSGS